MSEALDADALVATLGSALLERRIADPLMVGVVTGGVWVARRLHEVLGIREPLGELNINFYRDDFTRIGLHPRVTPSKLPYAVDERNIILVDDVLYTGRTIRAALNEIFDYGRPARVVLAVLIDRGARELPIQPDVSAGTMTLDGRQQIKLTGPDPLGLVIQEAG